MSSTPGKTAPKLLQDLLTYDPRYEDRAGRNLLTDPPPHHDPSQPPQRAVPLRNCRHVFMIKHDQSVLPVPGQAPDEKTVYKVASFCQNCLYHVDVTVDFQDHGVRKDPCPTRDCPLHHFIHRPDGAFDREILGMFNGPRIFRFQCSSNTCPVELRIRIHPPRLTDDYIHLMTDKIELRRRLESAKQIDPDRQDHKMARPVDGLDFLTSYLNDSLNPTKGKGRIPLLNRKFLVTFGRNCDDMLRDLGFTSAMEHNDGTNEEFCWYLPKPPPSSDPLAENSMRNKIDDAIHELSVHISNRPQSEKQGVRNNVYAPKPSVTEIERALGCLDYSKISLTRTQVQNAKGQEDHPYYAGLGAVGDFSDALLLFAYSRQVETDPVNSAYYFECLKDLAIGRKSSTLEEKVQMLASEGQTSRKEIAAAYAYFNIDPKYVSLLSDDIVIGTFKSRMADMSLVHEEETRQMLRVIGQARGSSKILQEASNAIETYSQALSWFDLDETTADEFVITMFTLKIQDSPANEKIARKALEIIAAHRNSDSLRRFLQDGSMADADMDIADAYSFLGIADRSGDIDLSALAVHRDLAIADHKDAVKANRAFELIAREKGAMVQQTKPAAKHPLEIWPVGCKNIGNTCYLNSVLQFLFTIKPLREIVLNFDEQKQECTPEAIQNKKVGRRVVTLERVERAQQFIQELRKLFLVMITAPSDSVTPERLLVILALLNESDYGILDGNSNVQPTENGTGHLGEVEGRPVYGPMPNPSASKEESSNPTSGSPTDVIMTDSDTAVTTNTSIDASQDDKDRGDVQQNQTNSEPLNQPPAAPSHPPPPVPPRPKASAQEKTVLQRAENAAQQQDAAEILNNILDLLRCGMKADNIMEDGEQMDKITSLFFSRIKTVQTTKGETSATLQLHDNILASPGDYARHLYRALDDEFDLGPVEGTDSLKYEEINRLPPILMINVRRLVFDKESKRAKRIESHLRLEDVLYLDRYLDQTTSLSSKELLSLREKKWETDKKRRELENMKKELETSELGTSRADDVEETAELLDGLEKLDADELIDVDAIPVAPGLSDAVRNEAEILRKKQESLDQDMKEVDETINSYFENLKDHPYRLQAVFIHRGSATGGHYYIYIHDFKEDIWRKYNDETVDEVKDLKEIFEQEEKFPGLSTGMVYVKQEDVLELVEAVKRDPRVPPPFPPAADHANQEMSQVDEKITQDVEMADAVEGSYTEVEYIEGVPADGPCCPMPMNHVLG
ncbi:cysteine proteinase [Mytilinidion resinicola]|uniref:ubiquitinyl hydrolase 1 n=1 Tax=Mytilinidion resinicola TaxID=574789 RepID=A0A6A6YZZ1_9PEZI|nr:cysteine proteinase [Mytilinidion resinicola]KAF2814049.1 cysteine proteinase [Mytilinidion resinicola]